MVYVPTFLQAILGFLLLIGPLVVLHELGHYLVARWCGVKSEVFSVGFGREVWGWTDKHGTRWRVAAIPLGGFVQFAGDANAMSEADDEAIAAMNSEDRSHTFAAAPLWKRALIVAAGPFANLLVAVLIFVAFLMVYGRVVSPPVVDGFAPNSPAQAAGLLVGDRIVAIDGAAIDEFNDITARVIPYPGQTVSLLIRRGGNEQVMPVKLMDFSQKDQFGNVSRVGLLGIRSGPLERVRVSPLQALPLALHETGMRVRMLGVGIKQIVTGQRSLKELGGPVKTAKFSGERLKMGWLAFIDFAAFISINLAFINLLPIPTLDGGHLALYAAEAVRRRPVDAKSQEWAFRTGLAFVLALMVFVTLNDIVSLFPFGR